MPDAFSEFLAKPDAESFVRLRQVVVNSPEFNFYSTEIDDLAALIDAEDFRGVPEKVATMMPDWLLSPRAHQLASFAARKSGQTDVARAEAFMAQACLRGILLSGEGSRVRPYLVTHVVDEFDVLEHLQKRLDEQRFESTDEAAFDRITCDDGAVLWFDVTPGLKTPV